jgi:hypothetical protein
MKLVREEIKEGFASHDSAVNEKFADLEEAERVHDVHVGGLEFVAAAAFTEWKPEVDASITSVKLELSKLNSFGRNAKGFEVSKIGVLPSMSAFELAPVGFHADGSYMHHVDTHHQDYGFGKLYTQTHDPVKGTVNNPLPHCSFRCILSSVRVASPSDP